MPLEEFLGRMDAQLDQVEQGDRLPGVDEPTVPGERGSRRYDELVARGLVPVGAAGWEVLRTCCESLGAPLPVPLDG